MSQTAKSQVGQKQTAAAPLRRRDAAHSSQNPAIRGAADRRIGEIVSITGSHALVMLEEDGDAAADRSNRPQLGAILSIDAGATIVFGLISAMSVPAPSLDRGVADLRLVEVELIGELTKATQKGPSRFRARRHLLSDAA